MKIFKIHNKFILINIGYNLFNDGKTIWFTFRIFGVGLEIDITTRKYFITNNKNCQIVLGKFYDSFPNQYLWNSLRVFKTKGYQK
tara:strand:+ start:1177 stop:1431 length:255 start_codon:yes stop_codon:yes gene_type:complete